MAVALLLDSWTASNLSKAITPTIITAAGIAMAVTRRTSLVLDRIESIFLPKEADLTLRGR
jgi:hypothetical protein